MDASTKFYTAFSLLVLGAFELWALFEIMIFDTDAAGHKMS